MGVEDNFLNLSVVKSNCFIELFFTLNDLCFILFLIQFKVQFQIIITKKIP